MPLAATNRAWLEAVEQNNPVERVTQIKTRERPTKEKLADLYSKRKMSINQIARITGFSRWSIARWIKVSGLGLRTRDENNSLRRRHIAPDRLSLNQMYWVEHMSLSEIGRRLGTSGSWVLLLMKKYEIPRRTTSEARIVYPKTPFSGNPIERAYLIGLRTGDLYSARNGNQVRINTSTTHPSMWELISSSLGRYGRISKTSSRLRAGFQWSVYGYLDKSFEFLLPKPIRIPSEILVDGVLFLSFLSGYADAEGNFRIFRDEHRVGVSLRINSEDEGILRDIRSALSSMGYHVYFGLLEKKGTHEGKTYRKNLWALGMFRSAEVVERAKNLSLRHPEKKEWARLIASTQEASWEQVKPLVLAHKQRIRKGVREFVDEAKREYDKKHRLRRK